MKQVSVEYAHIYTNEHVGEDQALSLKVLQGLETEGALTSLVVMVDDYSFPDPTFDYGSFTAWLASAGHAPNVTMRESQLIEQCDAVLAMIADEKAKSPIVEYIKGKKKYPCSLFIAAWYLVRLGILRHTAFPEAETASKLINILPESFKPFEDKAVEILRATPHADIVGQIENRYFQGRLIA